MSTPSRRTTRGDHITVAALVVCAFLVVAGAFGAALTRSTPADRASAANVAAESPGAVERVDMAGTPATLNPSVTAAPPEKAKVQEDTGALLGVPSVGLNVPLGAMNEVDRRITPPGFTEAYWVRNRGVPYTDPQSGTVYVVMHSLIGGGTGPGNYLIDEETGKSRVSVGAEISVAGTMYTVTGARAVAVGDLPGDRATWEDSPGRLVMITCLVTAGSSTVHSNMVITAEHTHS